MHGIKKKVWTVDFFPAILWLFAGITILLVHQGMRLGNIDIWSELPYWCVWFFQQYLVAYPFLTITVFGLVELFLLARVFFKGKKQFYIINLMGKVFILFIFVFFVYRISSLIGNRYFTPDQAYFPELAEAFLEGKLYLDSPPCIHDLTFFDGKWYVSFPPLASLLMLPQVAQGGAGSVNTVDFSVFFASINVVLIFLILERMNQLNWIHLETKNIFWLVALFAFSSVHWYMSATGMVWYIAQLLTITFAALAVYLILLSNSPFLCSTALALGILSRPNIVFIWPLLLAIYCQKKGIKRDEGFSKSLFSWVTASAVPITLVVGGLLYYNYLRFDNLFDFGYAYMNVESGLISDLKTYGQFNFYFLGQNLKTAFLNLPFWSSTYQGFVFNPEGMSIFFTTPAFLYLWRSFKKQVWVAGAWLSVGLLLIPLMLYYNTGAYQFGYRFLMDFIVPLMMLVALSASQKFSSLMKAFIVWGCVINFLGLLWILNFLP